MGSTIGRVDLKLLSRRECVKIDNRKYGRRQVTPLKVASMLCNSGEIVLLPDGCSSWFDACLGDFDATSHAR
jgi:hypothetical protein